MKYFKLKLFGLLVLSTGMAMAQSSQQTFEQNTTKLTKEHRFSKPINTGVNHTVLILESAFSTKPEQGDKIAAYDTKGNTVGFLVLQEGHNALAIWGDDLYTEEKDGLAEGEPFVLKYYNKNSNQFQKLQVTNWERGGADFHKNGMSVIAGFEQVEVSRDEMELFQNRPNPVNGTTSISFYIPSETFVVVNLKNALGQELIELARGNYKGGYHTLILDAGKLSSGSYFYSLITKTKTITKQFTCID